jgi:type IV fimbrial biogenesis protein FimT
MEVNRSSSKSKGFTIIEILITLAVAAILLGVAVPSLQNFTANSQVTVAANSIVAGLNLARSTAVTLGEEVVICPSADESTCAGDQWSKGWIVFDNADGNGALAESEIIRVVSQTGDLVVSEYNGNIVFESDGTAKMDSSVTLKICYKHSDVTDKCKEILVSPFGVVSSSTTPS